MAVDWQKRDDSPTFATRVENVSPSIIDTRTIDNFLAGVQKRIQKERDRLRHNSDEAYRLKRYSNIQRLKIIKEEMLKLREQL